MNRDPKEFQPFSISGPEKPFSVSIPTPQTHTPGEPFTVSIPQSPAAQTETETHERHWIEEIIDGPKPKKRKKIDYFSLLTQKEIKWRDNGKECLIIPIPEGFGSRPTVATAINRKISQLDLTGLNIKAWIPQGTKANVIYLTFYDHQLSPEKRFELFEKQWRKRNHGQTQENKKITAKKIPAKEIPPEVAYLNQVVNIAKTLLASGTETAHPEVFSPVEINTEISSPRISETELESLLEAAPMPPNTATLSSLDENPYTFFSTWSPSKGDSNPDFDLNFDHLDNLDQSMKDLEKAFDPSQ